MTDNQTSHQRSIPDADGGNGVWWRTAFLWCLAGLGVEFLWLLAARLLGMGDFDRGYVAGLIVGGFLVLANYRANQGNLAKPHDPR